MAEVLDKELIEKLNERSGKTELEIKAETGTEITNVDLIEKLDKQKGDLSFLEAGGKVIEKITDFFTGTKKTEFHELPEIGSADTGSWGSAAKIATGLMLTPNQKNQAHIIQEQIPNSRILKDKFDNIIVVMPDGKKFYLNKPGTSLQDVLQTTSQILQYIPGFSTAIKKAGGSWLKRWLYSGLAGGATSVAQDIAAMPLGAKGIDVPKAVISTAVPLGFEFGINPLIRMGWKKVVGNPQFYKIIDKPVEKIVNGKKTKVIEKEYVLTDKGKEAAKAAGIDTTQMNSQTIKTFANELSKGVETDVAASQAAAGGFGFRLTRSQAKGDEEAMAALYEAAKGTFGKEAQVVAMNFFKKQGIDIKSSAETLVQKFNSGAIERQTLEDAGQSIIQSLEKKFVKASDNYNTAYSLVNKQAVFNNKNSNIDVLIASIQKNIKEGTDIIDKEITPNTIKAMNWITTFVKNIKNKKVQKTTPTTLNSFETMRKKINELIGSAANKTDKKNLIGIKQEFDKLYDDSIDNLLFSGTKEGIKAIKNARSLFKKKAELFDINPIRKGALKIDDKGGKIIQKILHDPDVTPLKTIDWIFGVSQLGRKADSLSIIRRLKKVFNIDPKKSLGVQAKTNGDFQSLRSGFFEKLVRDSIRNGKFNPEQFVKTWEYLKSNNPALLRELFDGDEIKLTDKFVTEVRKTFKPRDLVNVSNTASSLMRALNGVSRQLVGILGFNIFNIQGLLMARSLHDRLRDLAGTKAASQLIDQEIIGNVIQQISPKLLSGETGIISEWLGQKRNINVPRVPPGLINQ